MEYCITHGPVPVSPAGEVSHYFLSGIPCGDYTELSEQSRGYLLGLEGHDGKRHGEHWQGWSSCSNFAKGLASVPSELA